MNMTEVPAGFVVCIDNTDYQASLERHKIYKVSRTTTQSQTVICGLSTKAEKITFIPLSDLSQSRFRQRYRNRSKWPCKVSGPTSAPARAHDRVRGAEAPSAHRTVRTGPYTALHARRIHRSTSNQCGSCRSERVACPCTAMNQPLGYALVTARVLDKAQRPRWEYTAAAA